MPAQTRPPLFDSEGQPLILGPVVGSGGEGAVYELRDRSDLVAKLYHKPLESQKASKIVSMAKFSNERLLKLTAWPNEPILAGSGPGSVVGFTMPKIADHKQAFSLYSPKLRLQEFPTASWQFLIRSAANAARAFAVVHESGHVIGDVNHGNLFVGNKATVRLIDCDSYQVTINGSRWYCEVGTPTHQPPELQNIRTYKGILRTPNHDNFGLAVIIFQMLFMARHPFSGRFLGTGEMPMERAIGEYRFAYGSNAAAMQMQPPPASLGLNGVTRQVALLFERAFSRQGSQQNGRPHPREWASALHELEQHLKKCAVNPAHQFVDSLNKCPWCDIEAASGIPLFQVSVVGSTQAGFSIAALWGKIASIPNPGPPPTLPHVDAAKVALTSEAHELQQATLSARISAEMLRMFGGTSRLDTLKVAIEKKAANARIEWQNIQQNWDDYTSSVKFQEMLSQLQDFRRQYDALPQKRLKALEELEANKLRLQLQAHLDQCRIARARIHGIGDAKKAMLQSYGIETAADVIEHQVLAVPGFGPVAWNNLKRWRTEQESRFRFQQAKAVDPAAVNAVERVILNVKFDLERKLNEGLSKLTVVSQHIAANRRTALSMAEKAAMDLAQAEVDLQAASNISQIRVPGKWAIIALAGASVASLVIATHEPRRTTAPAASQTYQGPRQVPPVVASPAPPPVPNMPPHVERDPTGQLHPQDGYDWVDNRKIAVRWVPGKISRQHAHVVASDTEGDWEPEDGYVWEDQKRKDKSVRWVPGTSSKKHQNILAGFAEGQWRPADGYVWVQSPPRPGDMRVRPAPIPGVATPVLIPADPFQRGLADRAELEQWVAGLSGEFRRGADWWAEHRSQTSAGTCGGIPGLSPNFISGCEAAKARLTPVDLKRKADPEYRRGFASYTGSATHETAPAGQAPVAPVPLLPNLQGPNTQSPNPTPGREEDSADRLNAQELQRLGGR